MSFLYTWYYYPLAEPIPLSRQLGFYLDNPRTEEEVNEATEFLIRSRDSEHSYFPLIAQSKDDIDRIEWNLFRFRDRFIELDSYVKERFASYDRANIVEFLARMIVIARYDDGGLKQEISEQYRRVEEGTPHPIIILPGEHPEVTNKSRLEDYSSLLSLLINDDIAEYWGGSFLLEEDSKIMTDDPWYHLIILSATSPHFSDGRLNMVEGWQWLFLPSVRQDLVTVTQSLDEALARGDAEKLLYVGNILKLAGTEVRDAKLNYCC